MTISTALSNLRTRVVIMVGIAFGIDATKQNIGDVLISESIIPYNTKRVGKDSTVSRGIETPCSKVLLNRFKNIKTTWQYFISNDVKAKLIPTRLLSGEELIDNLEHRDSLTRDNPDSKGGEMEGIGLLAACDGKADWIIVKGICDFADGDKGVSKEERQITAVNSALSVCMEIFNSSSVFEELNVFSNEVLLATEANGQDHINRVLFDVYSPYNQPYYIERLVDQSFTKKFEQLNIWIYGPTGCGKSNLILKNLISSGEEFISISLAACIGLGVADLFNEILYEITSKLSVSGPTKQFKSFPECTRAILDLLSKHCLNKRISIFIEEIPIGTDDEYKEFSSKFFSLLISKNFVVGLSTIKFVLSSINSPLQYLQPFQQKIHQQLIFLELGYWSQEDTTRLITLIKLEMNLAIDNKILNELLVSANGSPRFIKKFFRTVIALDKLDDESLHFALKETQKELNRY